MPTTEATMEIHENGHESFKSARSAIGFARAKGSEALGHAPELAGHARHRAALVAEKLPGAFGHMRSGAQTTVTSLQKMPDSGLGLLAAAAMGVGAGLRFAGAPRLVTLAGFVPASVLGFAIVSRPGRAQTSPARP
jgi:hypothetical protein